MYYQREFLAAGGLIGYGILNKDPFRSARHLRRAHSQRRSAGTPPVLQPTRFKYVIYLATAKGLDLDVPAKLLPSPTRAGGSLPSAGSVN
jgi:hypothetical protein